MKGLRLRRSFSHQGQVKAGKTKLGNPIPAPRGGRADGFLPVGKTRDNYGFAPGGAANPVQGTNAGFALLEGMQRGIEPAPLAGASPGGGPWVRSGRKTRSYFGP